MIIPRSPLSWFVLIVILAAFGLCIVTVFHKHRHVAPNCVADGVTIGCREVKP